MAYDTLLQISLAVLAAVGAAFFAGVQHGKASQARRVCQNIDHLVDGAPASDLSAEARIVVSSVLRALI